MWLTRFTLRQPIIATLFFVAVAVFGLIAYFSMGENIIPNVNFPIVSVTAVYPGASPDEMERLIVKPIEDQIQGLPHLDKVSATAQEGTASITVQFKLGTDVNFSATDVQHAVDAARLYLPNDLDPPLVEKFDVSAQPVLTEAITSTVLSPVELSNVITNEIVPALRGVKGVGAVVVGGKYTRQITVQPDLARLRSVGLTLSDVNNSLAAGNVSMPGGRLDQPFAESTVGVRADLTNASQIAHLPLMNPFALTAGTPAGSTGQPLRIGDVATVVDGYADHRVISTVNHVTANVVTISRDATSDTVKTTEAVRSAFKDLQARFPQIKFAEIDADLYFTRDSINGVLENLFEGILLTALVLLLFLHVWRSALVVMIAIPASLLATFFVMWMLGFTVNVLSLMGLSLTIGILVDDSIVVIENITRHREMGQPPDDAAITGRSEIGGAAIAITLVDVVVFAPIAFMSGIIGEYMREFGLVVVCATLFSLLVSFTLTPLLAAHWALVRKPRAPVGIFKAFADWFESVRHAYHDRWLPAAMAHPYITFFGSLGLVLGSIVLAGILMGSGVLPGEFQPYTEWGYASIDLNYPPGTPIDVTAAGAARIGLALEKMKGVKNVSVTVGRAENGATEIVGGNVAHIWAFLYQDQRHEERGIVSKVATLGALAPGARISSAGAANAGQPPIFFTLTGPAEELDAASKKLVNFIAKQPNTTDVTSSNAIVGPRLEINIDRDRAAVLGVSPQDAALAARAAVGGVISTRVRQREGLIDAVVQLPPATRNDPSQLQTVDVRSLTTGQLVPLGDVAAFTKTTEPPYIERQDRERVVRVTANTANGVPIGPIVDKVNQAINTPGFLPPGVHSKTEGDTQLFGDAITKIGLALLTSFILIYMLLVVLYRSYLTPLVIMMSVPAAIVGVIGFLIVLNLFNVAFPDFHIQLGRFYLRPFAGQTLNLFSMLGIVMLTGLVAKNGILLVDYANTMRTRGLALADAMRESATIRFRPIVMTTAAMIAGMTPLALGLTEGAEFRKSIGTVIIGGLTSSLFLTLFLVPVVYVAMVGFFDRVAQRKLARQLKVAKDDQDAVTGTALDAG
jgi:HAE1 family hydrophobic/amphiphilic exporter-1